MARWRGGLPLLLLSLAVLHLTLGTATMDVTATVYSTHPTSQTPMETSSFPSTSVSTATATIPPSSPETGASTLERSSTPLGTGSASSPTTPPPTAPAPTDTSAEPLTTLSDTTADTNTITGIPGSTPDHSQLPGSTAGTTPGISTLTKVSNPDTSTAPETLSAATSTEPSSLTTYSTQNMEVAPSTPTDSPTIPATLPICPTATPNSSASLFLSLRLTVPLDLGNTTVQEMVLFKLRGDLQTVFPRAGLSVEWRGKRRT